MTERSGQKVFSGLVKRLREAVGVAGTALATAPDGMRIYAIGDIHGRADLLDALLTEIEGDAHAGGDGFRNVLVFLGDYVDRGLQSKQVIDRLCEGALHGFESVFIKGNHEAAMLEFLRDAKFGRTWKYYGGLETLHSYGVTELTLSDDPKDFERARDHFEAVLPESHKNFLHSLELSAEFGGYFFAHAGVRPGISLSRQVEEDLLWIRDEFLESRHSFGKVVVHGHTPREEAVFRVNRIGIDTGAYMTGVLTALVLEGPSHRLIQTGEMQVSRRAAS